MLLIPFPPISLSFIFLSCHDRGEVCGVEVGPTVKVGLVGGQTRRWYGRIGSRRRLTSSEEPAEEEWVYLMRGEEWRELMDTSCDEKTSGSIQYDRVGSEACFGPFFVNCFSTTIH